MNQQYILGKNCQLPQLPVFVNNTGSTQRMLDTILTNRNNSMDFQKLINEKCTFGIQQSASISSYIIYRHRYALMQIVQWSI